MSQSATAAHPTSLQHQQRKRRLLVAWFIATAVAGFVSLLSAPAMGQAKSKYDVIEYKAQWFTDSKIMASIKRVQGQIINDPAALDDPQQRQFFGQIYQNIFNSMSDPTQFDKMQERRAGVMKDIFTAYKRGNTRVSAGLSAMAFKSCKAIARGNYHPGAQINAVLMMGELNDSEFNSLEKKPPVPMKAALPEFIAIVEGAEFNDGLKVAALQGIRRHAGLSGKSWSKAEQAKLGDMLLKIASSDPPKDRDLEAHGWVQMIATDTLLKFASDAQKDALAKLILDFPTKEESMVSETMLVHAARTTPMVPMPKDYKPKTDVVLKRWATQMVSTLSGEAARLEYLDKKTVGFSSGMMGGMMGESSMMESSMMGEGSMLYGGSSMGGVGGVKTPQTVEIMLARRMLNDVFESFHLGLTGTRKVAIPGDIKAGLIASLTDAQEKAEAMKLMALVDETTTALNDTSIATNPKYAEKLRELEHTLAVYVDPAKANVGPAPGPVIPMFMPGAGSPFGGFPDADPLGAAPAMAEPSAAAAPIAVPAAAAAPPVAPIAPAAGEPAAIPPPGAGEPAAAVAPPEPMEAPPN